MADLGELYTFTQLTTNAAGTAANPTTIEFWLREEVDGTELQWTFSPAVFPTGFTAMANPSTGTFTVAYTTRKPERVTGQWRLTGAFILVNPPETLLVRHSIISAIEPQTT